MTEYDAQQGRSASGLPPREDAVLVFGSTGKLGRQVVLQVTLVLGDSVKSAHCELCSFHLWAHPASTGAEGCYMLDV